MSAIHTPWGSSHVSPLSAMGLAAPLRDMAQSGPFANSPLPMARGAHKGRGGGRGSRGGGRSGGGRRGGSDSDGGGWGARRRGHSAGPPTARGRVASRRDDDWESEDSDGDGTGLADATLVVGASAFVTL
jgi:hypothetical protein